MIQEVKAKIFLFQICVPQSIQVVSMFLFLLHMPKMYDDHAEILTEKILLAVFIMQLTKIFFFEIMHDIAKFHKLFGFWN